MKLVGVPRTGYRQNNELSYSNTGNLFSAVVIYAESLVDYSKFTMIIFVIFYAHIMVI